MGVLFLKIIAVLTYAVLVVARFVFNTEVPDEIFYYGGFGIFLLYTATSDIPLPSNRTTIEKEKEKEKV